MSEIKIREIVESDIDIGFLESLDSLKKASNLDKNTAKNILKKIIIVISATFKASPRFNSEISTSIESGIPELGLENVSGEIHFNNDEIWANNINALYQGIPVTLKLPKINYSELDFIPFEISGFVNKEFIINQITSFFPGLFNKIENIRTYFSGQSQWTFTLQKSRNNDIGSSNKRIKLSTDLYDTEINLPSPLGKKENELRTLKLEADIDEVTVREININYDNSLFDFILSSCLLYTSPSPRDS